MRDFVEILGHPAFAGGAGVLALAVAAFLVDRGKVRAAAVAGVAAAALVAVVLAAAWQSRAGSGVVRSLVEEDAGNGCGEAVVRRDSLALQVEPADSAKLLAMLRRGDRVSIACANADQAAPGVKWTRVRLGIIEGWVAERVEARRGEYVVYLERLPPAQLHSVR